MAKRPTAHYVDNKQFLQAMKDWKEQCEEALQTGDEPPQVTNYIGECFFKDCEWIITQTKLYELYI